LHEHNRKLYEEIENKYLGNKDEEAMGITLAQPRLIVQFPPL
jgi:hypothetical protein